MLDVFAMIGECFVGVLDDGDEPPPDETLTDSPEAPPVTAIAPLEAPADSARAGAAAIASPAKLEQINAPTLCARTTTSFVGLRG